MRGLIAVFSDLSIDHRKRHILVLTSAGATGAESVTFNIGAL